MKQLARLRLRTVSLGASGVQVFIVVALGVLGVVGSNPASAGEWAFVGSRYQAMGGAGVATVNDSFASYWNPAALGTAQSWDTAIDTGVTASVEADILNSIDDLENLVESSAFEALVDDLNDGGALSPDSDITIALLEAQLANFDSAGDGVVGNFSTGLGLRWKNYTLFSRGIADFAVSPVYDSVRFSPTPDDDLNSILNNKSGSRIRGLGVIESGVGYGHSFFDGLLSVGANLKYLRGITFDKYVDSQSIEDADISFSDSDLRKTSDAFGLDLGIMSQPFDWLRVGLVARNVNAPKFDVRSTDDKDPNPVGSFTLEPQVRAGLALYPFSNDFLVIATDFDLTSNKSDLIDGFDSRLFSFGAEVKVPLWVLSMAFRGGGYMNTASGANQAFAFTAGVGLKVWVLSLDVAGGMSAKSSDVKGGDSFPSRVNGSIVLALRGDF